MSIGFFNVLAIVLIVCVLLVTFIALFNFILSFPLMLKDLLSMNSKESEDE